MRVDIIAWPKWMEKISWIPSMANGLSVITPRKYYLVFLFFLSSLFCISSKWPPLQGVLCHKKVMQFSFFPL